MSLASSIADAISNATADYQPDDLIDVLGLLISNLPAIIAAVAGCSVLVVAIRGQKKGVARWKRDRQLLDDVHKQTVNDHAEEDNFREQVDRIEARQERHDTLLAELVKDVRGLRRDDGVIHGQLREHAEAQRSLETRVVQAFRREHPDAEPL